MLRLFGYSGLMRRKACFKKSCRNSNRIFSGGGRWYWFNSISV